MAGDASFANVTLLLPFQGPNGSTSIVDRSLTPATCTATNGAALSTTRAIAGASSALFLDGVNDYVTTNRANTIGAGQFTVEAYVRRTAAAALMIADSQNQASPSAYFIFRAEADGSLSVFLRNSANGGAASATSAAGLIAGDDSAFVHVAATRNAANLITLWIAGVAVASVTSATSPNGPGTWNIGSQFGVADFGKGYLGGLRITEGVCRYTANFAPPTGPFPTGMGEISGTVKDSAAAAVARIIRAYRRDSGALLKEIYTCAPDADYSKVVLLLHGFGANPTVDRSLNAFTATLNGNAQVSTARGFLGGASSFLFDGADDYVTVPTSTVLGLESASAYTIELMVRRTVGGVIQGLIGTRHTSTNNGWTIRINANNTLQHYYAGGSSVTSVATVPINQDCHIAAVRNGANAYLFIDGVLVATSTTFANGTASTEPVRIGVESGALDGDYTGYIGAIRLTNGLARYTANFTAPTDRYPEFASGALGAYAFYTPTLDECEVIALDDSAGTLENDLIARVIPA